jgi:hypothetical protein
MILPFLLLISPGTAEIGPLIAQGGFTIKIEISVFSD